MGLFTKKVASTKDIDHGQRTVRAGETRKPAEPRTLRYSGMPGRSKPIRGAAKY